MERFKKGLNRLLFPGLAVILLGVLLSVILLLYTFVFEHENEPLAYLAYGISAYTTVTVCVRIPETVRRGKSFLHRNKHIHRYLTDISFRMHASLYMSLWINLLYAALKLLLGAYYHSVWFTTFGIYYTLLAIMRFLLLRYGKRSEFGKEIVPELKRYRACGVILLLMNVALSGVVVLVVLRNKGFEYAGYLIYLAALYTFYTTITATIHLIKFRKYRSPVMSAAKAVSFAAALVSLLSLETAMLSQFGGGDKAFRQLMTGMTGAGVCAVVLCMALYMIVSSTRQLKNIRSRLTGGENHGQ